MREYLIGLGLGSQSVALYMATIQRAEKWCRFAGGTLATAPASLIAAYVESQPGSWSNRNLMRAAFGHYWEMCERDRPPLKALRVPPKPEGECRALDEDDARVLVKYATAIAEQGDRRGLAVLLGLYTALRRAEIAGLPWRAIDGDKVRVVGKGRKDAVLPVHSRLGPILAAWPGNHVGWVFLGHRGYHVATATVWQWSLDVAEEAGIAERVPTHRLRHTALATANDSTGDLRGVQTLARHTKIQTTTIYTRTKAAKLRAIVEAIDY